MDNFLMSAEHGSFGKAIKKVKKEGLSAVMGAAMSISICPADDIAAVALTAFSGANEVSVHNAVMPPADTFKVKKPGLSLKGKKIE